MQDYMTAEEHGDNWSLYLDDSCERLPKFKDESIDLSIYSPPFQSLYVYSASPRDLGNSATREEFFEHYAYVIREMFRITKPGSLSCVHCADVGTTKATQGVTGLYDFPGDVIRAHVEAGWTYYGRVAVDKDPQALRHGQRVLTPNGWTPIESLAVGDSVMGSDGYSTKVEGVWPQGRGTIYRVTFSDGASVDCDAAHRWTVRNAADLRNDRWRTFRTDELIYDGVRSPSGRTRFEVPLVEPVLFAPQADPPIHPYILGALLGDGSLVQRSVSICTQREVVRRMAPLLPAGHSLREQPGTVKGDDAAVFRLLGTGSGRAARNEVTRALADLGVYGLRAWEKFIPGPYMTATPDDRRELLRGLLDTDGTVKLNGSVWFGTTSEQLAKDVVDVVRSLGGLAHIRCETTRQYSYLGEARQGKPAWLVCIELDGEPLVTLPHKVSRWRGTRRRWSRRIASIEPIATDDRTCITVAADDGLFVTEGYVVTHNSQAQRTKSQALLFVTKNKDSSRSRPAIGDTLLIFRKPGDRPTPIKTDVTNEEWIAWARPVWTGIREGGGTEANPATLNARIARTDADERHLHSLQLDFIERCVRLYSNPGETVLSPFAGVGSEVWMAVKKGRRGIGIELKPSYWQTSVRYLRELESEISEPDLFGDDALFDEEYQPVFHSDQALLGEQWLSEPGSPEFNEMYAEHLREEVDYMRQQIADLTEAIESNLRKAEELSAPDLFSTT